MDGAWIAQEIRVPIEHDGKRLDRFLQARFPWRSRAWVQRLLREHTRDDRGRPLKPSRLVRAGERILLHFQAEPPAPPPDLAIPVLYEDTDLFAVDKPAGIPVHARGKQRSRALVHLLRTRHPDLALDLAHRLDRETSGVLLLTKNREANSRLKDQLRRGEVRKEYLALVHGDLADDCAIDLPLRPARASAIRIKMEAHRDGSPARTEVRVLARYGAYTLVAARPRTGRQHQIRAHLAAIGHPIVGDRRYGDRGPAPRLALHAAHLGFEHPRTGARLSFHSPLPDDLRDLLRPRHP